MKFEPHDYQRLLTSRMVRCPRVAGFVEMGLGKTVSVLSAFQDLYAGLEVKGMLVISTVRVVENVWPEELAKWDHLQGMSFRVVRGGPVSRDIKVHDRLLGETNERKSKPNAEALEALAPGAAVYLTNYENVPALCMWMRKQKTLPFDMLVLDESTKMKSHKSRRFKMLKKELWRFNRRIILTGTPVPNSYLDLWAQIFILDEGKRLSDYFTHFRDRYFTYNPYAYETKIKDGAKEAIERRIKDVVVCLRAEDYLKLPPVVTNDIKVALPPALRVKYDKLDAEMALQLQTIDVEALNAATLSAKCRQFTSGALYGTDKRWEAIHDLKLDAVEDVLEEANGEPVLVVYEFRHELERLRQRWPKAPFIGGGCKDAEGSIKKWNAGKLRMMFVHPRSVAHGVNLQKGGRIMVWTSGTWGWDEYEQMVKRLHRQGQTKPVMVHRIVCPGTVDDDVLLAQSGKFKTHRELLEAMRARRAG